jgi:hypothetical protein
MATKGPNYVQGINLTTFIKIARFTFGDQNVIKGMKDGERQDFVIIVSEKVTDYDMERFRKYWDVRVKRLSN